MAKLIKVIENYKDKGFQRGEVFRKVYQLFTLEGDLIFERDPYVEKD